MKVLVTGGAGELGQYVINDLISHDYEVVSVDQKTQNGVNYRQIIADISDLGQTYGSMRDADAVIHLGAIRSPGGNPDEVVFRNNTIGTFNVFEAAAGLKVKKVVWASSINVLGFGFATKIFSPVYLPIDEDHPCLPQDSYGLSKLVGEEIAAAFSRRTGIPSISLRFTWIGYDHSYSAYLSSIWENPGRGRPNFWGYVDARDAATTCRLSLESEIQGHEAMYISADTTMMKIPTIELVHDYFSGTKEFHGKMEGLSSLFDCTKAKKLLGFHTEHHWKEYV
ncbi:MAG: NAD(P)-dependent oxidoreductase [Thaumarchaeota archaeon]|nr:NAD(P)-dependent oxidoreductase [Nitrososphaerota archaeon]